MKLSVILVLLLLTSAILAGCGGGSGSNPTVPDLLMGTVTTSTKFVNMTKYDQLLGGHYDFHLVLSSPNGYKPIGTKTINWDVMESNRVIEGCVKDENGSVFIAIVDNTIGEHQVVTLTKKIIIKDHLNITVTKTGEGYYDYELDITSE